MAAGPSLDALPSKVQEAVVLALADLQDPTPVPVEKVTYDARRGALTVWYRDGSGGGFGVDLSADRAEVIAEVADRIQELFN